MIEVKNLHYRYASKQALHNVSFKLEPASITALVGSNGAGKSTLLRCMAALDNPFSGSITLWGKSTHEDPRGCHRLLGYLSDQFGLYDNLTVKQSLTYMALAHKIPHFDVEARVEQVASQLSLTDRLHQKTGELSRGFRQRVAIAQAIIHQPKLLLLDEPASGLDPEARMELSALLKQLAIQGMTIMVSSHILSELDDYCSHMLKLNEGAVVSFESLNNYQNDHSQVLRMLLSRPTANAGKTLAAQLNVSQVVGEGAAFQFTFKGKITEQSVLLFNLVNAGLPVAEIVVVKRNLQDRYLSDIRLNTAIKQDNDKLKQDEQLAYASVGAEEHPPAPID
ncbi:MAG: ABC transporter ATP-binding protein [Gallionella sp.]|nr:ABC transporter ATP-binding protein [Gallionella sp.]MDD4958598.1 ABC transporter ATP-binding protein [Gallionella sp.]